MRNALLGSVGGLRLGPVWLRTLACSSDCGGSPSLSVSDGVVLGTEQLSTERVGVVILDHSAPAGRSLDRRPPTLWAAHRHVVADFGPDHEVVDVDDRGVGVVTGA